MKTLKFFVAIVALCFLAVSATSCASGHVCQAKKVGNHASR